MEVSVREQKRGWRASETSEGVVTVLVALLMSVVVVVMVGLR